MDQITGTYGFWLPMDISAHGAAIDRLIGILHWFMLLLFVGWGIFYVYCLVRFRARAGHTATYAPIKAMFTKYIEVAVVVIEVVLLFGLSTPVWFKYKGAPTGDAEHIRLVAEQFAWNFQYPGKDGKFGRTDVSLVSSENPLGLDPEDPAGKDDIITVNQMHFPVGKQVLVDISAKDVIHSFNIPVLRMKQDAIPGQRVPIWFEATQAGHFELACAQLCGLGHYRMRADVLSDTPADYAKWQAENTPAAPEAAAPEAAAPAETAPGAVPAPAPAPAPENGQATKTPQ